MSTHKSLINKKYDLEDRTAKFSENVLFLCKQLPNTNITSPLIFQLVKSATSVGANYCEADDAVSGRDFKNKIGICKKESREAKHFLRMLSVAVPEEKDKLRKLWLEAKELNLILNAIYHKLK